MFNITFLKLERVYWLYASDMVTHCSSTQTFPDPDALVSTTRCQQIPWRRPRHTFDLIFMSFQHSQTLKKNKKKNSEQNSIKVQHIQSEGLTSLLTSKSSFFFFQMHVVASKLAEAR